MVKGISKQVIVVQSPEPELFEQAIFILKEHAVSHGVSDEALLKEAKRMIAGSGVKRKKRNPHSGPVWAAAGALLTGLMWLISSAL
jgi:hypothetical protein